MSSIANIKTLKQCKNFSWDLPFSSAFRPKKCTKCGVINPWKHGVYCRQPDRGEKREDKNDKEEFNPMPIQRFYCQHCEKTFSILPECIPQRRWYIWATQQVALILILSGYSIYKVSKIVLPKYGTIKRWYDKFSDDFKLHRDAICSRFSAFAITNNFIDFWRLIFDKQDLGWAMRICQLTGVIIP
jgi:transposase-like protein